MPGFKKVKSPQKIRRGLMDELNNNLNDLETLIFRINRTNMATLAEGTSLTEMIAKKDILALWLSHGKCDECLPLVSGGRV